MRMIRSIVISILLIIAIGFTYTSFANKNTEVTVTKVTELASFSCGHCADFHKNTLPKFLETYVDTGKVEFEFVHFPNDHISLLVAAVVESHFIEPNDKNDLIAELFEKQDIWRNVDVWDTEIKKIVAKYGMNESMFNSAINDRGVLSEIAYKQLDYIQEHGIMSTPSFMFDDEVYSGNVSYSKFKKRLYK